MKTRRYSYGGREATITIKGLLARVSYIYIIKDLFLYLRSFVLNLVIQLILDYLIL